MLEFISRNRFLVVLLLLLLFAPSLLIGAFQLIGYVILFLLLLVVVGTLIFRWRITNLYEEMQQREGGGARGAKEEDVIGSTKSRGVSKDVGDYVDFEDIKEDK